MNKGELRTHFKQILQKLSASAELMSPRQDKQNKLVQNLLQFLGSRSGIWGAYQPLSQEASVLPATELSPGIRWVFPRLQQAHLQFCLPEFLEKTSFGILQPTAQCREFALNQIQGLLIPALAFDRYGNRLGRGKGYYDQTLSSFAGLKVGIGFAEQIYAGTLPTEPHDIQMNWIVTDEFLLECRS